MKPPIPWLFAVAISLQPATSFKNSLKSFSSLVIFGDSYTDQGVHSYTPDPNGTVREPVDITSTGGRNWPQYIKQYSSANVYDYAVNGAVCDKTFAASDRSGVKQGQVPAFLADNQWVNETTGEPALHNRDHETVYAVWIGTNDLGNRAFLAEQQPRGLSATSYTDCVFQQLDRLHEVGARNFIIMNLAPLDLAPQYALPENGAVDISPYWEDKSDYNSNFTQTSEKMRQYADLTNEVYRFQTPYQVLIAGRYSHSAFALFDMHTLMTDMWHNPADYFNGTAPLNTTGFITACQETTCVERSDWDSFMWYDELHPSEQTDRVIAKEFLEVVKGKSKYADYWFSK